jgi:hypothetical protein
MGKYVLVLLALILFVWGCDNRTTDPEDEVWSRVEVYENETLIHEEVLDKTDNNKFVVLDLQNESQIALDKFVNIYYSTEPGEEDEEIDRDYIILVEKEDHYTRFYSCSYQDTIVIDAMNGYSPIPSGQICGVFYTTDHYPYTNSSFVVVEDSTVVCNITTNVFGYFASDSLTFGNYQIIEQQYYPDGTFTDFDANNFYDDYLISEQEE